MKALAAPMHRPEWLEVEEEKEMTRERVREGKEKESGEEVKCPTAGPKRLGVETDVRLPWLLS